MLGCFKKCCPWISSNFPKSGRSNIQVAQKQVISGSPGATTQQTKETASSMTFTKMLLMPRGLSTVARQSQRSIQKPAQEVKNSSHKKVQDPPTQEALKGEKVPNLQKRILKTQAIATTELKSEPEHVLVNRINESPIKPPEIVVPNQKSFSNYVQNLQASNQQQEIDISPIERPNHKEKADFETPLRLIEIEQQLRASHRNVKFSIGEDDSGKTLKPKSYSPRQKMEKISCLQVIDPKAAKADQEGVELDRSSAVSQNQHSSKAQRVKGYKTLKYNSLLKGPQPAPVINETVQRKPPPIVPSPTKDPMSFKTQQALESQTSLRVNLEQKPVLGSQVAIASKQGSESKVAISCAEYSLDDPVKGFQVVCKPEPGSRTNKSNRRGKRRSLIMHHSPQKNFMSLLPPPKATKSMRALPPTKKPRSSQDLDEEQNGQEESRMNMTLNTTYIKKPSILGAKKSSNELGYSIKQNCTKIEQYIIVSKLGAGNCGEVHLAVDSLSKDKVVGIISPRQSRSCLSTNSEAKEFLLRKLKKTSKAKLP